MADNVIVKVPEQQFIRGEDGYSPVVTVEDIEHGHRVTITDREHPVEGQSFDVMDGASAYEQAADGGYSGTEAEFNEELANFKEYAQQANYARSDAIAAANTAGSYSSQARQAVNQAQSAMNGAQRAASSASESATSASGSETAAASSATAAAGSASDAATAKTAAETAQAAAESARDTAITTLQTEGAAQRTAIQQKGAEVIASIPPDYTDLTEDVSDLKSAVNKKAPVIIGTASGAIASFEDGADGMPIKALTVNIEPAQSGSGDPSPTNVRPISGWTGCNIVRSSTLDAQDGTTYSITFLAEAGTVYGGTLDVVNRKLTVNRVLVTLDGSNSAGLTWGTDSADLASIRFDTSSSPYLPMRFNSPLQSNYLIKVAPRSSQPWTIELAELNIEESARRMWIKIPSNVFSSQDLNGALAYFTEHPLQICYELATPIVYDLADIPEITTLLGTNNIWADCGDVSVEYPVDTQSAIDKQAADISDLKSALNGDGNINYRFAFTAGYGINSSGDTFTSSAAVKRISTFDYYPIEAADIEYVVTEGYRILIAFYESADVTTHLSNAAWITGSGKYTVPAGANYIRVCYASVGDSIALTVDDADKATLSHTTVLKDTLAEQSLLNDASILLVNKNNLISGFIDNTRLDVRTKLEVSATNQCTTDYISVYPGFIISTTFNLSSAIYGHIFYDLDKNPLYAYPSVFENMVLTVPDDCYFVRFTIQNASRSTAKAVYVQNNFIDDKTSWLAIGDSITEGVFSTGPSSTVNYNNGWPSRLAAARSYDVALATHRGLGYTVSGSDGTTINDLWTEVNALSSDYNLVTIALGINDYNTAASTLTAILQSAKTFISNVSDKFKNARVIVITPFNTSRHGDVSTIYGYNAANGDKTLADIESGLFDICAEMGIECIKASNQFLLNVNNISSILLDGVHPSDYGHTLIAKTMAHYLDY